MFSGKVKNIASFAMWVRTEGSTRQIQQFDYFSTK
jgi:hypothetical protein